MDRRKNQKKKRKKKEEKTKNKTKAAFDRRLLMMIPYWKLYAWYSVSMVVKYKNDILIFLSISIFFFFSFCICLIYILDLISVETKLIRIKMCFPCF